MIPTKVVGAMLAPILIAVALGRSRNNNKRHNKLGVCTEQKYTATLSDQEEVPPTNTKAIGSLNLRQREVV